MAEGRGRVRCRECGSTYDVVEGVCPSCVTRPADPRSHREGCLMGADCECGLAERRKGSS